MHLPTLAAAFLLSATTSTAFSLKFNHVGVSVANLTLQREFYTKILNFTTFVESCDSPDNSYNTAKLSTPDGGATIELVQIAGSVRGGNTTDMASAAHQQGYFHWALQVDDLDGVYEELVVGKGLKSVSAPAAGCKPGERYAAVKDPEENIIELIEELN